MFTITTSFAQAQKSSEIETKTFCYATKGSDSLFLDRYNDPSITGKKPCVIFMFGGAFRTGHRSSPPFVPFFHFLARQGYYVVAPDYRLGMTQVMGREGMSMEEFATTFEKAQDIASEDLFDATRFILEQASLWDVDPQKIVISGSSAGAITVLNGEYLLCNEAPIATSILPADFDYAGVIAFAGAIIRESQELAWKRNPCPILMFHGNADNAVSYGKTMFDGKFGYFGSRYLSDQFRQMKTPYYLYAAANRDHEMAGSPMLEMQGVIADFLARFVQEKRPLMIEVWEDAVGRADLKKDYTIRDYIGACFGPVLAPQK